MRKVCEMLAQSVFVDGPQLTDELDAVIIRLEHCAAIISSRHAALLALQTVVINEWIPRLGAAAGHNSAMPSADKLVEEGTAIITELERALASAPPASPESVGVGLTRIHEWIFLAEKESPNEVKGLLSRISKQIVQLMASVAIAPIISSGRFDPQSQSVVEVKDTVDQALDHCLSETIRPGYLFAGKVLKLEQVAVFRFKAAPDIDTAELKS